MGVSGTDLLFTILARDEASRKFRKIGDEATDAARKIELLNRVSASGSKTSGVLLALGAVPPLAAAAAGALLAVPAALTTAAAAAGVLALAMQGTGKAFAGIKEEAAGLKSQVVDTGDAIQTQLAGPLNGDLTRIRGSLAALTPDMATLGGVIGQVGHSLAGWATSTSTVDQFRKIFHDSGVQVSYLGDALKNTLGLTLDLAVAGGPTMTAFARGLATVTQNLRAFFAEQASTGRLDALFKTLQISMSGLLGALRPLGEALFNVFSSAGTQAAAKTLFETLSTGTHIVSGLLNAFAALPSGIQSAMINLGAFGLIASKTVGALATFGEWTTKIGGRLEKVGLATSGMAKGLTTAGSAIAGMAGPIGLAIGGLLLLASVADKVGHPFQPVVYEVSKLVEGLKLFNDTGRITGQLNEATGGSFTNLANRLHNAEEATAKARQALADYRKEHGQGAEVITAEEKALAVAYGRSSDAVRQQRTNLDQVSKSVAELYRSGNVQGAATAFTQMRDALLNEGYSMDYINGKFKDYLDASGGMTASQYQMAAGSQAAAQAARIMAGSWNEAVNAAGSLHEAFMQLHGTFISAQEAEVAAEQAARAFDEAIKASKGSVDAHTQSGGMAVTTLAAMARATDAAMESAYKDAAAKGDERAAVEAANAVYSRHREQLISSAMAAGMTQAAANALADQWLGMPKNVYTSVSSNSAFVWAEVNALKVKLDSLPRNTELWITTYHQYIDLYTQAVTGAHHDYQRWGSITPVHAAKGLLSKAAIFRGGTRPLYAFAEPDTGQEAFIPKRGNMSRSRNIAKRVVDDWLGGPGELWGGGTPMPTGPTSGSGAGGATINLTVNAGMGADGQKVGAAIVEALKAYERGNGTGWRSN